jgi:HlyD family secretion protein
MNRLAVLTFPNQTKIVITVEVKLIATKGEYASWRATRATGDFDLRTFSIRAYPVDKVPELRPGMSAYLDWRKRE